MTRPQNIVIDFCELTDTLSTRNEKSKTSRDVASVTKYMFDQLASLLTHERRRWKPAEWDDIKLDHDLFVTITSDLENASVLTPAFSSSWTSSSSRCSRTLTSSTACVKRRTARATFSGDHLLLECLFINSSWRTTTSSALFNSRATRFARDFSSLTYSR